MKINRNLLSKFFNVAFYAIILIFIMSRIPIVFEHFKTEGQQAPSFGVDLLDQSKFSTATMNRPLVLVFWATWCGPCEVELGRLQKLIESGNIKPEDVLAISSYEDKSIVKQAQSERGYSFLIGVDTSGQVASLFKVAATPTIVFLNNDRTISWMTSGLSPTLEMRVKGFINP